MRFPNFDLLRLFLALEVLFVHLFGWSYGFEPTMPVRPVPAFLAISGVMILRSWQSSQSTWHFWLKRIRRIVPAFVASLVLVWLLHGWSGLTSSLATYATFGAVTGSPNGPLWSLSCEELLYGLLCLASLAGVLNAKSVRVVLPVVIVGFIYGQFLDPSGAPRLWLPLLPSFLVGIFIHYHPRALTWLRIRYTALAVLALWAANWQMPSTILVPYLTLLGSYLVLQVGFAPQLPIAVPLDISYGVYVYHLPLVLAIIRVTSSPFVVWVGSVFATLSIAWVSRRFLEAPFLANRGPSLSMSGRQPALDGEA